MTDRTPDNSGRDRPRVLRCTCCGREVALTPAWTKRFARAGWPRCCGETVTVAPARPQDAPPAPARRR